MFSSAKVWSRWALCGCVILGLVGACGSKDDKKSPDTRRGQGDDDDSSGNGGGGGSQPGDGGTDSGPQGGTAATAGADAQGGAAAAAGGELGEGGLAGRGGEGAGGEGGAGGPPGLPLPDTARGSTGPLVFQITSARSPAVPGQHATYLITVGNTSDVDVADVSVVLNVPSGLEFSSALESVPSSSYCGNGSCAAGEEATWALGMLGPRSTKTIVLSPRVLGTIGDGSTLTLPFRLNATDVSSLILEKSLPVQAVPHAELSLEADADPVVPGQTFELAVQVGQVSTDWIDATSLRLELPGSLLLGEVSDAGSVDETGAVVWSLGDVEVGASLRRTVKVQVHPDAIAGDTLSPRVSLAFDGGLELDNVAEGQVSVIPEPQPLSLSVTTLFGPARAGGLVSYQINASNTGLRALSNVELLVLVPRGLGFSSALDAEPDSSYCGNGACSGGELAEWSLGTLEAGTTRTVSLSAEVVSNQAGDGTILSMPFVLRSEGAQQVNALRSMPVFSQPDGRLVLGTAVSPVTPGQTFTYELAIGQIGVTALNTAKLTAFLPAAVSIGAISDGGTSEGQVVTWDLADVAVGATVQRSVEITVAEAAVAGSTLLARAHLSYDDDLELDAHSEYAVSVVAQPLPLEASLGVPASAVVPGAVAACTTSIENVSTRSVDNVTLAMRVVGMSFSSVQSAEPDSSYCGNGACSDGEEAAWALGSVPVAGTATVSLFPTLTASLPGGSLVTVRQLINATNLGATIQLQKTILTKP